MCEQCMKSLRIDALDYFKCMYDFYGTFGIRNEVDTEELDEDALMSKETYNHLIRMHEGADTWELLKMISDHEKAKWKREQKEKAFDMAFRMYVKYNPGLTEDEIEEAREKLEELYNKENS